MSMLIAKFFRSLPSEMRGSDAQRLSSSHHSSEWSPVESTRLHTTPSWSATSISERTSTPTLSSPAEPPCTPVSPTECRRRSPPWPQPQWRSKSLLHQRGSTPSGSEDPSLLPSPPSNRCGSPSRSTMSLVHLLCTENAFKLFFLLFILHFWLLSPNAFLYRFRSLYLILVIVQLELKLIVWKLI